MVTIISPVTREKKDSAQHQNEKKHQSEFNAELEKAMEKLQPTTIYTTYNSHSQLHVLSYASQREYTI